MAYKKAYFDQMQNTHLLQIVICAVFSPKAVYCVSMKHCVPITLDHVFCGKRQTSCDMSNTTDSFHLALQYIIFKN